MNYIKFYETETGKRVPMGFDVHHIDQNRLNNEIKNLVALPKELHQSYHKNIFSSFKGDTGIINNLKGSFERGTAYNGNILGTLTEFVSIFNECKKYIDYRDFLLGEIPNIHNLNL